MLHVNGHMFRRGSGEGFEIKDEDSGFVLENDISERKLNELNENDSSMVGNSEALLTLGVSGLHPRVVAPPNKENSKASELKKSFEDMAHIWQEKRLWLATNKLVKKDQLYEKPGKTSLPVAPLKGESPELPSLASALRTKIKSRFTTPLYSFPINTTTLLIPTLSKQSSISEVDLDQSQSNSPLSRKNLERNTSLTDTSYQRQSLPASQNFQQVLFKYQRVSSVTQLPPLCEHTGHIIDSQEQESANIPLHNVVSQTKEPISNHQEQEGLVIKKTRKSLNEGFDCLVTRSEDLVPVSTTNQIVQSGDLSARPRAISSPVQRRSFSSELLASAKTKFEAVGLKYRPSINCLPHHNGYPPTVQSKNQRFLGRYRTSSTPDFLNCPARIPLGHLKTRSLSLPSLRHKAQERKSPLFFAISNKTLLISANRLESPIVITHQSHLPSKYLRRLPVLTPALIFKVRMPPHATHSSCASVTPSPTRLTNGVMPTPPASVATAASRRSGSNNATHGSLHGGPAGADAPPNSPTGGFSELESFSVADAVSRGLQHSVQSNGLQDDSPGSNYYDDGNYYDDYDSPANFYDGHAYQQAESHQYPADPAHYYDDDLRVRDAGYHYEDGNPPFVAAGLPSTPVQAMSNDTTLSNPRTPSRGGDSDNDRIQSQSLTQAIHDGATRRATLQTTPTHRPIHRASRTTLGSQSVRNQTATADTSFYRAPTFSDLGVEYVEDETPGRTRGERFTNFILSCMCARPRKYQS